MTGPVCFGIIGFGWRASGYLRIARMLPDRFHTGGICVRNLEKYKPAAAGWNIPLFTRPDELAADCDFLLLALSKTSMPSMLARLIALDKPLLIETPPAYDAASLEAVARLDPGGCPVQVVLDFTRSQYFSPIRRGRILIRGTHGEVRDNEVTRIHADGSVETVTITRIQDGQEGSLAPLSLRELRAGPDCLFRSPFHPAPLSDEEIAMAQVLERMADFARGGRPFYPLSDALADVRLSLAIEESIRTGAAVRLDV